MRIGSCTGTRRGNTRFVDHDIEHRVDHDFEHRAHYHHNPPTVDRIGADHLVAPANHS